MTPGAVVIQNDADALKDSVPLEASAEANDGPKILEIIHENNISLYYVTKCATCYRNPKMHHHQM